MIKQDKMENKVCAKCIYGDEKCILGDKIVCFITSSVLRINERDG